MKSNYLTKPLEDKIIVWWQSCNRFMLMEKPAYEAMILLEGSLDENATSEWLQNKYKIHPEKAIAFVRDVNREISDTRNKEKFIAEQGRCLTINDCPQVFSDKYYLFNGMVVHLSYGLEEVLEMIHPIFRHLGTVAREGAINYHLWFSDDTYFISREGKLTGSWTAEKSHFFTGKIFMEFLNICYQKQEEDWLAVLHAAAISDGDSCILFTGQSGSGKSILSLLLQANGYTVMADDFVPVQREDCMVRTFPGAISVKEEAAAKLSSLYGQLKNAIEYHNTFSDKKGRYLPSKQDVYNQPKPVKAIVQIKYNENVACNFHKTSNSTLFAELIPDSWTSPEIECAKQFLDWYAALPCYFLEYSDNKKMRQVVRSLFVDKYE